MFMTGVLCTVCGAQVYLKILEDWGWALAKNFRVQCRSGDRKHTYLYFILAWLAETSTFPLKLLNVIQRNLTKSKISTSSIRFVFFGPIRKTRWPHRPVIGWEKQMTSKCKYWSIKKLQEIKNKWQKIETWQNMVLCSIYHVCALTFWKLCKFYQAKQRIILLIFCRTKHIFVGKSDRSDNFQELLTILHCVLYFNTSHKYCR